MSVFRLFDRETRKMVPTEKEIILYNSIIDSINTLVQAGQVFYRNGKIDKPTIGVGMANTGLVIFEWIKKPALKEII